MPAYIPDEVMHTFAVIGTYDEIAERLLERYRDVATHTEFSIPAAAPADQDTLRGMVRALQAG